jgi:hypothetical protein
MKKSLFAARTVALTPVGFEAAHFALTGSVQPWGAVLAAGFASFGLLGIVNTIFKTLKREAPQRFIAVSQGWQMEAGRAEDVPYLLRAMKKEQEGLQLTIHEAAVMACATEVKSKSKPVIAAPVTENWTVDKKYMPLPRGLDSYSGAELQQKFHVNTVHNTGFSDDDIFEHRIKCELCASWSPGKAAELSSHYKIEPDVAMPRPLALHPKLSHDIADNGEIETNWLAKSIDHKERVFMGDRFTPEEIRAHAEQCETCASVVELPSEDGQLILEEPVALQVGYHFEGEPPDFDREDLKRTFDDALNRVRQGVGLPPAQFAPEPWAPFTVADVHTAKALGPLPHGCDTVRLPSGLLATQSAIAELARIPDEALAMPKPITVKVDGKPHAKMTEQVNAARRDQAIREKVVKAIAEQKCGVPESFSDDDIQDLAEAAGVDAGPVHLVRPFQAGVECPRGHYGIHTFEQHPDAYGVMIRTCSDEECGITWTESSE